MADSLEKINNKLLVTYIFFFFKNSSSDREKLLKFKAEGREFEKLRLLEQSIRTVKGRNNFW